MTRARWKSKGTVPLLLSILMMALLLTSCGFHLQGRQPLPAAFAHTYVDTKDEQTDFVQNLRKALLSSRVNVVATRGSAEAVITVHDDELTERILSYRHATSPPNTSSPTSSISR